MGPIDTIALLFFFLYKPHILFLKLKGIKDRKTSCGSWLRKFNIKMAVCPKLIYRFNTIPIKSQSAYLQEWQGDPKIHMYLTQNSQNNLEKEQTWKIHIS